ncbi:hypothetical protein SPRG_17142 [Saprolegnia parasitica CBS 223.65]|uniref:Kazal-like domain-containing protein n=1 Tax=Saprolegnia parasitica (strain CBS 223.65) TaxID=695850 RepID=A0A067BRP4_SAPPC|nr:hypothetical protein SPRG_17142 [Saprolegnia parasitica CBS 223.65]KDO17332.1 hypothetical protein SPRG_17142 [Saprolegnia parasitica CBS 223.65]|eukprot:XP_012211959.1 hypothetical protein SPRG_17142 [Saprolegnia parasitica CBS 223.65]
MRLSSLALGLAALAVASAIDGRLPCDRGVLLEKAGVQTLQTCLATSNLTLDTLDKAHAAALCAVPACVSVVTMASTTTTCPNGQEYAGLCDAATPTATTGPATTSPMTALPTSSAASTTGAPKTPAVAPSSASAVSLATVVAVTSAILLVKGT